MSLNAATLRIMAEKGLSITDVIEIAEAMEVRKDSTAAERQRRHREKKAATRDTVTRDVTRDTPPNDINSNPPEVTTGAIAPSVTRRTRQPDLFVCPDGVNPDHWRDFMANRKRKNLAKTQTAYDGILADLDRFADDEWPPGRLVQHAAAKGWGSINDPRNGKFENGRSQQLTSLRGSRPDPALDLMRQGETQLAAERNREAPDRGTWAALPAVRTG